MLRSSPKNNAPKDLADAISRLGEMVAAARCVVPFTGAGISTECGIPDFRSPGGLWERNAPIQYDEFVTSQEARNEAWRRRFELEAAFGKAVPGRGHRTLASLWKRGKSPGVITQNIDNLHQDSGIDPACVVELHGNTTYATCLTCGLRYELSWVRQRFEASGGEAPSCHCGGFIKTATISFGQMMPFEAMEQADEMTAQADLFLAIGSSLVVWPAAGFPLKAKRHGAKLVILNREPTPLDAEADLVIGHDIGEVLGPLADR